MNIRCSITYSMSPYRNTLWAPREQYEYTVERKHVKEREHVPLSIVRKAATAKVLFVRLRTLS